MWRLVAAIDQRKELKNLPLSIQRVFARIAPGNYDGVSSEQRATAFMRVGLRAMRADFFHQAPADPNCGLVRHIYSSSQKRSFKYFSAESAKTVTITARSSLGIRAATVKQPSNAAAALGLTSKPSSRARRFTRR